MAATISETIKKIADGESAKVDITTTDEQTIRLDCTYKESTAPNFFLTFPPNTLPENIDTKQYCPITITDNKSSLTLTAKILEIPGKRSIEFSAKNAVNPESLREYFRVNTSVAMKARFDPTTPGGQIKPWKLAGQTLDISGSGLLAILSEEPQTKHHIEIEIDLKNGKQTIECIGHIIRCKRLRKERFQVAFHFDSISARHRDAIIAFCLQEQRNQLREKIQTAN